MLYRRCCSKIFKSVAVCVRMYSSCKKKAVTMDTLNRNIIKMEYAVRGPILTRAIQIEKELAEGKKFPFDKILKGNLGDCHAMGGVPITFVRQCIALAAYPELLKEPCMPEDAKDRVCTLLQHCRGNSIGAYSESPGIEMIRKQVACFIKERDCGIDCSWEDIVLTAGATEAIKGLLKLFMGKVDGKKSGIMAPIPQYPLYSATIVEYGMELIGYYLDEDNNWSLSIKELKKSIEEARDNCINPRVLVVINPGNPTGQVLTRKNIEDVIKFAHEEGLFLFADEVYQYNVYDEDSEFHSFKKVMMEMGEPYCNLELASFMSCSKGFFGECGLRGGYAELINIDPDVKLMYLKSISASLCASIVGQLCVYVLTNPPQKGEPSYEQFEKEKWGTLNELGVKAEMAYEMLNSIEGFCCNKVQGAMYAFPKLELPKKVVEAAKKKKMAPDAFYVFRLLEKTGIVMVAGSGFKQLPGTHHFRTTILPPTDTLRNMFEIIKKYHADFLAKYK